MIRLLALLLLLSIPASAYELGGNHWEQVTDRTADGGGVALAITDPQNLYIRGTVSETVTLFDATTAPTVGIRNTIANGGTGVITVQDFDGTDLTTLSAGAWVEFQLVDNTTSAGVFNLRFAQGVGGGGGVDIDGLTEESTVASDDTFPFFDDDAASNKKITFSNLSALLGLDIDGLTEDSTIVSGDFIPYFDTVAGNNRKIDWIDFVLNFEIDGLTEQSTIANTDLLLWHDLATGLNKSTSLLDFTLNLPVDQLTQKSTVASADLILLQEASSGLNKSIDFSDFSGLIALDIDGLSEDSTIQTGDFIPYFDTVAGQNRKIDWIDFILNFEIDALTEQSTIANTDLLLWHDLATGLNKSVNWLDFLINLAVPDLTSTSTLDSGDFFVLHDGATGENRKVDATTVTAAGGGGGGSAAILPIQLVSSGDSPPTTIVVNDLNPIVFPAGVDRDVRFVIPLDRYTVGDQIKLIIRGYSSSTGNVVTETTASLYEPGVVSWAAGAPNTRNNSQVVSLPGTINFGFRSELLELTDGSGEINSVALATEDMLTVNFKREGTNASDTATGDLFITQISVNLAP